MYRINTRVKRKTYSVWPCRGERCCPANGGCRRRYTGGRTRAARNPTYAHWDRQSASRCRDTNRERCVRFGADLRTENVGRLASAVRNDCGTRLHSPALTGGSPNGGVASSAPKEDCPTVAYHWAAREREHGRGCGRNCQGTDDTRHWRKIRAATRADSRTASAPREKLSEFSLSSLRCPLSAPLSSVQKINETNTSILNR